MKSSSLEVAEILESSSRAIATWTIDQQYRDDDTMEARYGSSGRRMWNQEVVTRLAYLTEAVALNYEQILIDNALWAKTAFTARELNLDDLYKNLDCMKSVLVEQLPKSISNVTTPIITKALECLLQNSTHLENPISHAGASSDFARMYLMHLLKRDQMEAERLITELTKNGLTFSQICEGVLVPAMAEIGYLWQIQEASIADEHYCTNATHRILEGLRGKTPRKELNGYLMVSASVCGDMHDLGIKIMSAIYEMQGWTVECLGSNTPTQEIVNSVAPQIYRGGANLLALSASTSLRIRAVQSVIACVRATDAGKNIPILVGGPPFQNRNDLWRLVGASAQSSSASASLETALALVAHSNHANRRAT